MGMICTRCHMETPGDIDVKTLRKMSPETITDLCANWRCDDCMAEEAENAAESNSDR